MTDPRLDRRFPDAAAMETAALRRLPGFIRDYVEGGIGADGQGGDGQVSAARRQGPGSGDQGEGGGPHQPTTAFTRTEEPAGAAGSTQPSTAAPSAFRKRPT